MMRERTEPRQVKSVTFMTKRDYLTRVACKKADSFRKANTSTVNGRIINAAKRIIFDDVTGNDVNITRKENLDTIVSAIRYIVEEVMELTPAEYDALYSVTFNQKGLLDHAIRKVASWVPATVRKETLFDNKRILFKMCWPEYYQTHFDKPTAYNIFYADGEIKSNLSRAGKPKQVINEIEEVRILNNGSFSSAKKARKRVYSYGAEVDEVVFKAMWNMFGYLNISTKELFDCLANPKKSSFNKIGCMKIIEKRECYPSPLDFFMWNSSVEYQMEHIDEYMEARKNAKLPELPILELRYKAFKKSQERDDIREL